MNGNNLLKLLICLTLPLLSGCSPELRYRADVWRLVSVETSDTVPIPGGRISRPDYVSLQVKFECTTQNSMSDLGISQIYVTDSKGNRYSSKVVITQFDPPSQVPKRNLILFEVPKDSHGFRLYVLDLSPIDLGK